MKKYCKKGKNISFKTLNKSTKIKTCGLRCCVISSMNCLNKSNNNSNYIVDRDKKTINYGNSDIMGWLRKNKIKSFELEKIE